MMRRALMVTFAAALLQAQETPEITGNWAGRLARNIMPWLGDLAAGGGKRVIVNFTKGRHGELTGMIYDGSHAAAGFDFTSISWIGNRLSFTIKPPGGAMSFSGTLSEDGNFIDGWLQGVALKLERANHVHVPENVAKNQPGKLTIAIPAVPAGDSSTVFTRALEKLAGTARHLLKYTCLETIDRTYYSEPAKKIGAGLMTQGPANACDGKRFLDNRDLTLDARDRLRLEVAVAGGTEIHSWPTASRFDSRSVFQMVSTGPISSGAFGTLLVDIFENSGTQYRFVEKRRDGSRELFEYSFVVAPAVSHYSVRAGNGWKVTGYSGSFEIYAETAELAHLVIETDQLPPESQMCRDKTEIDYHYLLIGDSQFLLPSKSVFETVSPNETETRSITTFSACHEYTAESSLILEDAATTAAAKVAPKTAEPLPVGISLTLALLTPIDTQYAAAGDAISAKVTKAVRAPGSNKIVVQAGAIAHGRILQMRHQYSSSQFLFSIRFDTLDQKGALSPLSIRLDRDLKQEKAHSKSGLTTRGAEFSLPPPQATGESGSWFSAPARNGGFVMPAGFESKWITVAQ